MGKMLRLCTTLVFACNVGGLLYEYGNVELGFVNALLLGANIYAFFDDF